MVDYPCDIISMFKINHTIAFRGINVNYQVSTENCKIDSTYQFVHVVFTFVSKFPAMSATERIPGFPVQYNKLKRMTCTLVNLEANKNRTKHIYISQSSVETKKKKKHGHKEET